MFLVDFNKQNAVFIIRYWICKAKKAQSQAPKSFEMMMMFQFEIFIVTVCNLIVYLPSFVELYLLSRVFCIIIIQN